MRLLLDSHVLLWSLRDPDRIHPAAKRAMSEPGTVYVVSVVTFWELAIKQARGQLRAPADLLARVRALDYEILPVSAEHAWEVRKLPPHHRDPFDRMLVAQAQLEDLPLVTHDRQLERYDLRIIRA